MPDKILKIFEAFYCAKCVLQYYWLHTDGDDHANSQVNIHNIKKIVELLTSSEIAVKLLPYDGQFHRAFVERYSNSKHTIYVLSSEDELWRRFAIVKEICHILIDDESEFQPDPCITIEGVMDDTQPFQEQSKSEADSEFLAEIIALELIYPLEYRDHDLDQIDGKKATAKDISKIRSVPEKYIVTALHRDRIDSYRQIWRLLPDVDPKNLDEKISW